MTDTQVYSLKTKQPIPEPSTQVYSLKTKTRITNDDMVDEASLLTEEDMAQKTASGGGCATRKKACKDCSCGRAELEAKGIDIQPEVCPLPAPPCMWPYLIEVELPTLHQKNSTVQWSAQKWNYPVLGTPESGTALGNAVASMPEVVACAMAAGGPENGAHTVAGLAWRTVSRML